MRFFLSFDSSHGGRRRLLIMGGRIIVAGVMVLAAGWFMMAHRRFAPAVSRNFSIATRTISELAPHLHNPRTDAVSSPGHGAVLTSDVWVADAPMWVTALEWRAENAPQEVIHHALVQRLDRPDPLCPATWFQEIATTAIDAPHRTEFPPPYGIFLPAGTPIGVGAMLHNPLPPYGPGGTYQDVSVVLGLTIEPAAASRRTRALEYNRLRLDRTPCQYPSHQGLAALDTEEHAAFAAAEAFDVPARARHRQFASVSLRGARADSGSYIFERSGILMGFGGHIHGWEGGEELALVLNGGELYRLKSRHTGSDPWSWKTRFYWLKRPVRVGAGDTISVSATYSNPSNEPLVGSAMGMIGFYFAPDEDGK